MNLSKMFSTGFAFLVLGFFSTGNIHASEYIWMMDFFRDSTPNEVLQREVRKNSEPLLRKTRKAPKDHLSLQAGMSQLSTTPIFKHELNENIALTIHNAKAEDGKDYLNPFVILYLKEKDKFEILLTRWCEHFIINEERTIEGMKNESWSWVHHMEHEDQNIEKENKQTVVTNLVFIIYNRPKDYRNTGFRDLLRALVELELITHEQSRRCKIAITK